MPLSTDRASAEGREGGRDDSPSEERAQARLVGGEVDSGEDVAKACLVGSEVGSGEDVAHACLVGSDIGPNEGVAHACLVGNDVVDLEDPEAIGAHLRERFVQRILCQEEQERLRVAGDPLSFLWTLFAAKEAAYKAAVKLDPTTIFAHRRFVVGADLGTVRFGALELSLIVEEGEGYVHAVAILEGREPRWRVGAATEDPSAEVRRLLCEDAAQIVGCAPAALEVVRDPKPGSWDGKGPPRLVWRGSGAPVGVDVSLSHHGRFVAHSLI